VPADAEVWVEGQKTTETGAVRLFESPPVTPGHKYLYRIRARWTDNGHPADEVRDITVFPGSNVDVDFTKKKKERVPAPRPAA
jgi:uncharacterized protein (TIGR03000 family)